MDAAFVPGKLKLKGGGVAKKKSKSKSKNLPELPEESSKPVSAEVTIKTPLKTKAELAFERRQRDLQAERVLKKAQTSHRDKVEKFNKHLENLTELHDIPKVSWTK